MNFNREQQDAVNAGKGIFAVYATAGAGKTAVASARVARLLREGNAIDGILGLTFTAESAKNLRTRIEKLAPIPASDQVCGVMTFHSLALAFAVRERDHFPMKLADNPLATGGQAAKLLHTVAGRHSLNGKALQSQISLWKRSRITPARAIEKAEKTGTGHAYALAYKEYDRMTRDAGMLDFDSLLVEMVNLLESNPAVRSRWQREYVFADEVQDADELQWAVMALLTERFGNLYVVGDANQAIFKWRSAMPEYLLEIEKRFPGVHKLYMGTNYRSTESIVEFTKHLAPIQTELIERIRSVKELGVIPQIVQYRDPIEEAEQVVRKVSQVPDLNSAAILCRTNFGLRAVEECLCAANVKYHLLGDSGFWNRPEIRNIMAFAQCVVGVTDNSILGCIRAPFACSRFLKKKILADEIKEAQKKATPAAWNLLAGKQDHTIRDFRSFLWSLTAFRHLPPREALKGVITKLNCLNYYKEEEHVDGDNSPASNIIELVNIAGRYNTLTDFIRFFYRVVAASKNRKGVAVSTIHSAKGREWDDVFVIQFCEGMLPHKKSEDMIEEQALAFVACSRAESRLHLSYSGIRSRFLPQ